MCLPFVLPYFSFYYTWNFMHCSRGRLSAVSFCFIHFFFVFLNPLFYVLFFTSYCSRIFRYSSKSFFHSLIFLCRLPSVYTVYTLYLFMACCDRFKMLFTLRDLFKFFVLSVKVTLIALNGQAVFDLERFKFS